MRQRKVKNLETKLEALSGLVVDDPYAAKGIWRTLFDADGVAGGDVPLYLEIGCGKGKFISELAARERDSLFVAVEGNPNAILRAMEKVRDAGLTNVLFVSKYITDITEWFEQGEITGIYLNFSDPLPKTRTAKNRLTHRKKLTQYFEILEDDGIVTFKTDNDGLFDFTIEEIYASNLMIDELIRDMHALAKLKEVDGGANEYDDDIDDDIRTEYEYKFSELGEKIKRVKISRIKSEAGAQQEGDKKMEIKISNTIFAAPNGRLIQNDILKKVYIEKTKAQCFDFMSKVYGQIEVPVSISPFIPVMSNYSCPGDKILVWDKEETEYQAKAMEASRRIETYALERPYDFVDFDAKIKKILRIQDRLLITTSFVDGAGSDANSPSSGVNGTVMSAPTFNSDDLNKIVDSFSNISPDKKVILYIKLTLPPDEEDVMEGLDLEPFDRLPSNVLLVLGHEEVDADGVVEKRALDVVGPNFETVDEFVTLALYSIHAIKN